MREMKSSTIRLRGAIAVAAAACLLAGCLDLAPTQSATTPGARGTKKKPPAPQAEPDAAPILANGGASLGSAGGTTAVSGGIVSNGGAGGVSQASGVMSPVSGVVPPVGSGIVPPGGGNVIAAGAGNLAPPGEGLVEIPPADGIGLGSTAATAVLSGLVKLPAGVLADNGGSLVGNNSGGLISDGAGGLISDGAGGLIGDGAGAYVTLRVPRFTLAQAAAPVIEVGLVDAAGALLPGTARVTADAEGRYAFASVPATGAFFVQARVTSGQDTWTLGALGRLAATGETKLDVTAASTLVTEKTRVVLAEQDQGLDDLPLARLAALIDVLDRAIAADTTLDFKAGGASLAAALDQRLQRITGLVDRARDLDRNVGTPILRTKTALADGVFSPEHVAYDRAGNLFVAGLNDHKVYKIPAGTDRLEVFFQGGDLKFPHGIVCDAAGNVYVGRRIERTAADPENTTGNDTPGKQVFKIDPQGLTATPLAHTFSSPWGLAFAPDGKTLLVAEQGAQDVIAYDTSTDTARVVATDIQYPNGIAVDSRGVTYVTHLRAVWDRPNPDENGWRGAITAIAQDGVKSQFYAGTKSVTGADALEGIAVDAADNLYVTNNWGNTIFKFTPKQKKIETFLAFNQPTGVAFDPQGNLIVADYVLGTLSRITP